MQDQTSPPPGFYEDDDGQQRWWDGVDWSEQRIGHPSEPEPDSPSIASKVLTVIFPLPALFIGLLMGAFGHRHAWKVVKLSLIVIAIEFAVGFVLAIASAPSESKASEAQAHTTITCEPCSYPYQRWVDEAKVPTPGVTIQVVENVRGCWGSETTPLGCADENNWIGLRPRSPFLTHWTFLHELGHVFDYSDMTAWARLRFRELGGWMGAWEPEGVNEIFADTYRLCAWPRVREEVLAPAGLRRPLALETACQMIRRVG